MNPSLSVWLQTSLDAAAAVYATMLLLWLISLPIKNASIVDIFWGLGYLLVAGVAASINAPLDVRSRLVIAIVAVWAVRLAGYVAWRNLGHGEDKRYAAMRAHHGPRFAWVSLFTVFLLQGTILLIVTLPITATIVSSRIAEITSGRLAPLSLLALFGFGLWLVGFIFETVGDFQLPRFKAAPDSRGRVMDRGLWRYTRHPNYFGESAMAWGIYLFAASAGAWWTAIAPLLITLLLLKFSGVSLLEQTIVDRRPDYADYQRRTSAFLPWPPKATA